MKNAIIAILAVATLTFGTICLRQNRKVTENQTTVAELKQNVAELEEKLQEKERVASSLQTRLQDTRANVIAKAEHASQLEQTLTNKAQAEAKARSENPMAEMFKSSETRDLIRTQQKAVLGPMIEKNYGSLFASLQLAPEQASALKDLILKKTMVDAEMGMSLMTGESDQAKREETVKNAKTEKDSINEQIKQFLGEDNFTQFEAYEKTQPERMALNMFKDQQGSGANALNPDQEAQLVQFMSEERQNFKFTTDFTDQSKITGDFASYFTEEKIGQFQQEMEQLYQKYSTRAQQVLSPPQLEQFDKFLKSQRDLQGVGLKMAMKMFGGQSGK
jgi:hypothetical protein